MVVHRGLANTMEIPESALLFQAKRFVINVDLIYTVVNLEIFTHPKNEIKQKRQVFHQRHAAVYHDAVASAYKA